MPIVRRQTKHSKHPVRCLDCTPSRNLVMFLVHISCVRPRATIACGGECKSSSFMPGPTEQHRRGCIGNIATESVLRGRIIFLRWVQHRPQQVVGSSSSLCKTQPSGTTNSAVATGASAPFSKSVLSVLSFSVVDVGETL